MPQFDPIPILGPGGAIARRLHRLRGAARADDDGPGRRPGDRGRVAPDGRGGDGRRQELRLPRPGDPGGGRDGQEGRRLDPHDQPPGAAPREGHPVPPGGDAAGVLGGAGQGAVELHQPPAGSTRRPPGPGRPSGRPEEFDQLGEIRLWSGRTERRQPVRPRLQAARRRSGTPWPASTATAWARSARGTATASTTRPGGG